MPTTLFLLNDPPYGTERSCNALRLAGALASRDGEQVKVFLMGEAAACAVAGQHVPAGRHNVELMLRLVSHHGAEVGVCATYMDERGLQDEHLAEGSHRSSLSQLTDWVQWADRMLVF